MIRFCAEIHQFNEIDQVIFNAAYHRNKPAAVMGSTLGSQAFAFLHGDAHHGTDKHEAFFSYGGAFFQAAEPMTLGEFNKVRMIDLKQNRHMTTSETVGAMCRRMTGGGRGDMLSYSV